MPTGPASDWLEARGFGRLKDRVSAEAFLRRPEVDWESLCALGFQGQGEVSVHLLAGHPCDVYDGLLRQPLALCPGSQAGDRRSLCRCSEFNRLPCSTRCTGSRHSHYHPQTHYQLTRMGIMSSRGTKSRGDLLPCKPPDSKNIINFIQ